MKQLVVFVGVIVFSLSVASADDHKYAMKDLKALIGQKGYREVLQHLEDIAPSDRNQDWIDVAGQAAAGYLATAEDGEKLQLMVQIEKQYPTIIKSSAYTKARLDAVPKAFSKCYSEAGSSYGGQDERLAGYDKCIAIAKTFTGAVEGTSTVEMLTASNATSRAYVAFERLDVSVDGRKGALVLHHSADDSGLTLKILTGSGSGELTGISGTARIEIDEEKNHHFTLTYDL